MDLIGLLEMFGDQLEMSDEIAEKLPDETVITLTIISMVIDTYARNHNRSSWELWETMYEAAKFVHEECGDYMRNEKT